MNRENLALDFKVLTKGLKYKLLLYEGFFQLRGKILSLLISTHKVNEREIFIYAWEKGKREFDRDGGIVKGNNFALTLIRIAFKSTDKLNGYATTCSSSKKRHFESKDKQK